MLKKMIYQIYTTYSTKCHAVRCVNRVNLNNRVNLKIKIRMIMINSKVVHFQHKMLKIAFHFTMPDCFQCMKV